MKILTDPNKLRQIVTKSEGKILVGVDLSVLEIMPLNNTTTHITKARALFDSHPETLPEIDKSGFYVLKPGCYEVTLNEGIRLPKNCFGVTYSRSSLHRGGNHIFNGVFEPGYIARNMHCSLRVNNLLKIEIGAYLCQIIIYQGTFKKDYNQQGQYKND